MHQKNYVAVTGLIFLLIAIVHALRLLYRWPAEIGGYEAPLWFSGVALVIAAYLALQSSRLRR